eukprot:TRINITY_DN545_c0_g1_i1.p1 TRINITY_DN545_c0_g1~~TRINITY_DN545_c0_g1_i1.p1  ORF type:complete len:593 (+),score=135.14 TRINITY_DN545_c0_g1_i1:77-1855(+)
MSASKASSSSTKAPTKAPTRAPTSSPPSTTTTSIQPTQSPASAATTTSPPSATEEPPSSSQPIGTNSTTTTSGGSTTSTSSSSSSLNLRLGFAITGWAGVLLYGGSLFLLYFNRNNQFVKAKDVFWLYFLAFSFLVLNTFASAYHQQDNCAVDMMSSLFAYVVFIFVMSLYTVRLWTLSHKFAIAEEQIESFDMFAKFSRTSGKDVHKVPDSVIESSKGWYRRHQWMVSRWFSVFFTFFLSVTVVALSLYFSSIRLRDGCTPMTQDDMHSRAYGYIVVFAIAVIANLGISRRSASSEYFSQFGLLGEYYLVGLLSGVFCACMVLAHLADQGPQSFKRVNSISDALTLAYMFLLFVISIAYPLYQCYSKESFPEGDEDGLKPYAEHLKDLGSLLSTNSGFLCFRAFLTVEQELHKLLFVESAKAYRAAASNILQEEQDPAVKNAKLLDLALNLHTDFLSNGCPLRDNLPLRVTQQITDNLPGAEDSEEIKREYSGISISEESPAPVGFGNNRRRRRASSPRSAAAALETQGLNSQMKFSELPGIFDEAVELVMEDLSHNAFPRFKTSILYQELELHARRNSFRRKSLVELKIM